jgi:hypothetical protein
VLADHSLQILLYIQEQSHSFSTISFFQPGCLICDSEVSELLPFCTFGNLCLLKSHLSTMASTSALDPDLAEFDSDECDDSDDEFVEFNRHEKAGGSMIQRMVQNHETDLVESRRQYEELDFVDGNDVGAYRRSYIKNTVLNYFKLIEHEYMEPTSHYNLRSLTLLLLALQFVLLA